MASPRPDPRRLVPLFAALYLLAAPALAAQSAAERASLDSFRDTLARLTTPAPLAALESGRVRGAVQLIREGVRDLRVAELGTGRGAYDEAIQTLERAITARRDWPYAWYALGLTQLAMYQRQFVAKATDYTLSGTSYREAAMRSLGQAIAADSTFAPAAEGLAGLVTSLGHRLLPRHLTEPIRRAQGIAGNGAEVCLAAARIAYGRRDYQAALGSLETYLQRGGDPGMAQVDRARALMALGRGDAAVRAYLDGAGRVDEQGRLAYREDIAWVGSAAELAAFDSLPAAALGAWVARFWRERDALSLRAPDERLAEHLRRWVYAHEHFLMHRPDDVPANAEGFGPQDQASLFEVGAVAEVLTQIVGAGIPVFRTYRRTQWEIDDRGVIYLRHGEPTRRVSSVAGPPNASWAYDLPEGRRIFHFLASPALGTQDATTLTAALPLNSEMLDARAGLDARYAELAYQIESVRMAVKTQLQLRRATLAAAKAEAAGSKGGTTASVEQLENSINSEDMPRFRPFTLQRDVLRNRNAIAAAVTTDGFPLHFKESLDAIVQLYGVGLDEAEHRRILAVFAVPGRTLTPKPRPDGGPGLVYPLSIRLIALDRTTGTVRQLDTTRIFLARDTLRGSQHLTGLLQLEVPPGRYQVRALLHQPGADAGTGVGRDSVEIPGPAEQLILSDLVLGRAESGLNWSYRGEQVPLNPLNAFQTGSNAELFYEVGGLVSGTRYTVAMLVRKASDKPEATPSLQLGFDFTATAPYERVHRTLGLGNLKPGAYLLQVAVSEADSPREALRARALNVLAN